MLRLYISLVRSKLDYGCIVYGSTRKSYLKVLDPVHNQGLRLCLGAFRTSPVESLYVDAHEPSLGGRHAKLSLHYASKIKSLPKHPAHDVVFDSKYMKLFGARPNTIRTSGLRIKHFLTASNIDFSDILETPSHFLLSPWYVRPPKIVVDLMHLKKGSHRCIYLLESFHGNMREIPWLYFCVYRWFTRWELCRLCYSFFIKHHNFHEIAWIHIYRWNLGNH